MPHLHLTQDSAALLAVILGAVAVVLHLVRGRRRWLPFAAAATRETAIVLALFALWQLAGSLALTKVTGAFDRAREIVAVERWLHIPSEVWVQHLVLPHPDLVRTLNVFYLYVHINSIVIFLVWLFLRHRDAYPWARDTLVLVTGSCLLVQMFPVAPPRMLQGYGFVDTALVYHQSIYGPFGSGIADQLSAMPSVHVAWALLIAFVVLRVSPSRWRWLVLAHPVATVLAVVATANHFWMDGIVAAAILALAVQVTLAIDRRRQARRVPVLAAARPLEEPVEV
jgi:hypothetical protein